LYESLYDSEITTLWMQFIAQSRMGLRDSAMSYICPDQDTSPGIAKVLRLTNLAKRFAAVFRVPPWVVERVETDDYSVQLKELVQRAPAIHRAFHNQMTLEPRALQQLNLVLVDATGLPYALLSIITEYMTLSVGDFATTCLGDDVDATHSGPPSTKRRLGDDVTATHSEPPSTKIRRVA